MFMKIVTLFEDTILNAIMIQLSCFHRPKLYGGETTTKMARCFSVYILKYLQ
jgi:hypothetical protein